MRRGARLALLAAVPLAALGLALALGVGRAESAACELEELPEQEGGHLASLPDGFEYVSFPPTSGPSADTPLRWDTYSRPVSQFRLVHNLLHGGLGVQYGPDVDEADVEALLAWYAADPDGIVVAPLPRLGNDIALTAWRSLATCGEFQERTFTSFRSRHRFDGPERPPRETMRRGRGGIPNPLGLRVTPQPVRGQAVLAFRFADAATIAVSIHRGRAGTPPVRELARISTIPGALVRLTWDRRDDEGRRVPSGTYAAVAKVVSGGRPAASTSLFEVR